MSEAAPVRTRAVPIELNAERLHGIALRGAWSLSGDHTQFGGFSGLEVSEERLFAVTDFGWWFGADLGLGDELILRNARMAPMRGPTGLPYSKAGGDAEDLVLSGDVLSVAFERDHRIMRLGADGRLGGIIRARSFEQLRSNLGLEGLAAHPSGGLLALTEASGDYLPVFRLGPGGARDQISFHVPGRHQITGADLGPDGQLYVLRRKYSLIKGGSMQIVRYAIGDDGWPLADSAERLAFIGWHSGIDNMEGISVEEGADGVLRLWLISDDNFSPLQRTLLVLFEIGTAAEPATAIGQGGSG